MTKKKSEEKRSEPIVTPVGVAHYPRLSQADELDGRYKLSLELSEEDAESLLQKMSEAAKRWGVREKFPVKVKDGITLITLKTHKPPRVLDASNKPIPPEVRIGAGSRVRARGSLAPYDGFEGGVTFYLNAVQVIELADSAGGFEATDGYRYDGGDDTPF